MLSGLAATPGDRQPRLHERAWSQIRLTSLAIWGCQVRRARASLTDPPAACAPSRSAPAATACPAPVSPCLQATPDCHSVNTTDHERGLAFAHEALLGVPPDRRDTTWDCSSRDNPHAPRLKFWAALERPKCDDTAAILWPDRSNSVEAMLRRTLCGTPATWHPMGGRGCRAAATLRTGTGARSHYHSGISGKINRTARLGSVRASRVSKTPSEPLYTEVTARCLTPLRMSPPQCRK